MISLHTNLSSLITQNNLTTSTTKLNQAIERLSTGSKINHAADNAANYSIAKNMSTQLSACDVAADNIAMGMDLLSVAQDTIAGMQDRGSRIHALITQARNGTYGTDSLNAMTQEAQALVSEINRLYMNTEYNGIKLFDSIEIPDWMNEIENAKAENNGFLDKIDKLEPEVVVKNPVDLADAIKNNKSIGIGDAETLAKLAELVNSGTTCKGKTIVLTNDIDLSAYRDDGGWTPIGSNNKSFIGNFNGNGHKITGLYISDDSASSVRCVGLFGSADNAEIRDIAVEGEVRGFGSAGLLLGQAKEGVTIYNCHAYGRVANTTANKWNLFVGNGLARVSNCWAESEMNYLLMAASSDDNLNANNVQVAENCTLIASVNPSIVLYYDSSGSNFRYDLQNEKNTELQLQVGINSSSNSQISIDKKMDINLSISNLKSDSAYNSITNFMNLLSQKSTELGAAQNRLDSALESTMVQMDNLTSSLSTIRDADIGEVSSDFIRQQILQQACATLMSTANQSPSIALQLL